MKLVLGLRLGLALLALLCVAARGLRFGAAVRGCAAASCVLASAWAPGLGRGGRGLPSAAAAAEAAPAIPLSRYFDAVRKELDPEQGESLQRIKKDIDEANWDDLKAFTREYDAGFRGGILKSTWKQLGDNKKRGIEISNSFTFDLIGLNQAARKADKDDALKRFQDVQQDIRDFLTLEPK